MIEDLFGINLFCRLIDQHTIVLILFVRIVHSLSMVFHSVSLPTITIFLSLYVCTHQSFSSKTSFQ